MADRRRLTVSKCDPVKPRSPRGKSDQKSLLAEAIGALKEQYSGNTVISVSSKTDRDLARRGSFQGKDMEMQGTVPEKESEPALRKMGIGFSCNKGQKPESPNQDSFAVVIVEGKFGLFGVFDGHGPVGHFVSDIAREKLLFEFLKHPNRDTDTKKAFEETFVGVQKHLESDEVTRTRKVDTSNSGSTCTMSYMDYEKGICTVAHVGDSRSTLSGLDKASGKMEYIADLTVDHKPSLPEEKKRIESANPPGRVIFDGYYNHRVFAQNAMYPGLNMSRALGDVVAHKEAGLTAMPDVKVFDIKDPAYDKYSALSLFICSDGVWEFIESPQATTKVYAFDDLQQGVAQLTKDSYKAWMDDSEGEISDDITAVVVTLQK